MADTEGDTLTEELSGQERADTNMENVGDASSNSDCPSRAANNIRHSLRRSERIPKHKVMFDSGPVCHSAFVLCALMCISNHSPLPSYVF